MIKYISKYSSQVARYNWSFFKIPKKNGRRISITKLYSDYDGSIHKYRCNYCGGMWQVYQNPHHNLKTCEVANFYKKRVI